MIWLDNSRIIAIFAVVFLHVAAGVMSDNSFGTEYWWVGHVYDSFVRWCVPVFVMISGALLLDPSKKEDLATFYAKRLSKILVPILFWSVFFLVWSFFIAQIKGRDIDFFDLWSKVISGTPYYHMWFLYMIVSLYFFTPFLRKVIANSSERELNILIFTSLAMSIVNSIYTNITSAGSALFINWFLQYVPFFLIGYFIRREASNLSNNIWIFIFAVSAMVTIFGSYILAKNSNLKYGLYFYDYVSVSVVPMSISLMYILKRFDMAIISVSFTRKLSTLTLGVYLIHPVILDVVTLTKYGGSFFHPIFFIPVATVLIFVLSVGISYAIHRIPFVRRII